MKFVINFIICYLFNYVKLFFWGIIRRVIVLSFCKLDGLNCCGFDVFPVFCFNLSFIYTIDSGMILLNNLQVLTKITNKGRSWLIILLENNWKLKCSQISWLILNNPGAWVIIKLIGENLIENFIKMHFGDFHRSLIQLRVSIFLGPNQPV